MTEPAPTPAAPPPDSSLTPEQYSYRLMADVGEAAKAEAGTGEASYRWSVNYLIMVDSVKLIRSYLGKTPEAFQDAMIIKLYYALKGLKSLNEDWRPSMQKAMLSEQEEQKRFGKLTERQNIAATDIDRDPPPDASHLSPVPTREDLYNMVKSLQKQILTLERKINTDSICPD